MHFAFDPRTELLRENLPDLMWSRIHPPESVFEQQLGDLDDRWTWDSVPVPDELRATLREQGVFTRSWVDTIDSAGRRLVISDADCREAVGNAIALCRVLGEIRPQ
ncbi:hypothetical protein [Streptomyces litmocidini]|uniref:hypothetical protein n=1 Tax=Streptomyces litmocidini TaxID=67318 RepID=UPI0036FE9445